MFVDVPAGRLAGLEMQYEDVHEGAEVEWARGGESKNSNFLLCE